MVHLSRRLMAVANLVTESGVTADIGCDHGYTSIYLVQNGISPSAIAMDVRKGPLERAREHISESGLEDYIETRLSDGLTALFAGEADSIVIAGMGGATMEKILKEGRDAAAGARELILQPQSELYRFREFLEREGYRIEAEDMVKEDGKFYPMMRVVPDRGRENLNEEEKLCGPLLLKGMHPVLGEYLGWRKHQLEHVLSHISRCASPEAEEKRGEELRQELLVLEKALSYFE